VRRRLIRALVLLVAAAAASPSARADTTCDVANRDEWTIGPMAFENVKNPVYVSPGNGRNGNVVNCKFTWTGTTLDFQIPKALTGAGTDLVVNGEVNLPGSGPLHFTAPAKGISFKLRLSKSVDVQLLGGTIHLPKGTTLNVVNDSAVRIRGAEVTGTLRYSAQNIAWKDAAVQPPFGFPELHRSLKSRGTVTFRTYLHDATTRVVGGVFISPQKTQGAALTSRDDTHRVNVRKVTAHALTLEVAEGHVALAVAGVEADASLVVKASKALPLPVFADGVASVKRLRASMLPTPSIGTFSTFDVDGLKYTPVKLPAGQYYTKDELAAAKELGVRTLRRVQLDAIEDGQKALAATDVFSLFATIPSSDVLPACRDFLKRKAGFTEVDDVQIGDQLITARVGQAAPAGELAEALYLNISPSIVDQNLVLWFAMDFARPKGATIDHASSGDLLGTFAAQTAQADSAFSKVDDPKAEIPIDLPEIKDASLTAAGTFEGSGNYTLQSKNVTYKLTLSGSALLLDREGAHLLAKVTFQ
jgi:hypothetical protein